MAGASTETGYAGRPRTSGVLAMATVLDIAILAPVAPRHHHRAEQAVACLFSVRPGAKTDPADPHRYDLPEPQISWQPAWWERLQGADLHLAHHLCAFAC